MLAFQKGDLKKLFNSSGQDYRDMNLKEKLPTLSEADALALLLRHGNLVKRPFLLAPKFGLVGFKPDAWKQAFDSQHVA
jgi:arsenate reductase-like glutaredoxin family protein